MANNKQLIKNSLAVASHCFFNLKPFIVNGRLDRWLTPPTNASSFSRFSMIVLYVSSRKNCFFDTQQTYLILTIQKMTQLQVVIFILMQWVHVLLI